MSGLFLEFGRSASRAKYQITDTTVYAVAPLVAGLFVVSSELIWLRFRGPNVYDSFDLIASIMGLVTINRLLTHFGFVDDSGATEQ